MEPTAQSRPQEQVPRWYLELGVYADPNLYLRIANCVSASGIEDWFFRDNERFQGKSPASLVQGGNLEPLERMVYYLESGSPS
jgi:hypothetical protein